jgi:hypothetical protein
MSKFRKKPVVINAVRWTGANIQEVTDFLMKMEGARLRANDGVDSTVIVGKTRAEWDAGMLTIHTLEGVMRANPGDWIICGVKNELYPCAHDVFESTYDSVEELESNERRLGHRLS